MLNRDRTFQQGFWIDPVEPERQHQSGPVRRGELHVPTAMSRLGTDPRGRPRRASIAPA